MPKFCYYKPSNPAAFCRYHRWLMSPKQIKAKGCLHKQNIGNICPHLVKKEHEFWIARNKRRASIQPGKNEGGK